MLVEAKFPSVTMQYSVVLIVLCVWTIQLKTSAVVCRLTQPSSSLKLFGVAVSFLSSGPRSSQETQHLPFDLRNYMKK